MTYPLGRLVSAPDASATVRYDFNDRNAVAPRSITRDFTLGVPSLDTAYDAVSQLYGPRTPSFGHTVQGTKSDALAAIAVFSRELLRHSNWFMFQLDAFTRPIWLRLYPSGPEALSLENVYVDTETGDPELVPDLWEVRATFTAESFAYGERIEAVTGAVLTMDSAADNPMRLVLPTIRGDAPTRLRVKVVSEPGTYPLPESWLLGCVAGDAQMADPFNEIGTDDGFTDWGDTDTAADNAAYSGGSYRDVTILAGTKNVSVRLSGQHTGLVRGRYKILLRCELDGDTTGRTYLLQYGQENTTNSDVLYGQAVPVSVAATESFQGWVDLGEFSFPFGLADAPVDVAGLSDPSFKLRMGTADGSAGFARIDAFKFIPIDGPHVNLSRLLSTTYTVNALRRGTFDSDYESVWQYDATPNFLEGAVSPQGGFPLADPASEQNILELIPTMSRAPFAGTGHHTSVATTVTVDVSYHPRLLHLDGRP